MNKQQIAAVKFDQGGLVPAIVQEAGTRRVLMLAYMNAESLALSLETGYTHFWSRSRSSLWKKGETSGHLQRIRSIRYDCDADTLLVAVDQTGPACHTGEKSCFFRTLGAPGAGDETGAPGSACGVLADLDEVIADRAERPREGSYVNSLLEGGVGFAGEKVIEESREVVEAARGESDERVVYEGADLLFHLMVLLRTRGLGLKDVCRELETRFGNRPK